MVIVRIQYGALRQKFDSLRSNNGSAMHHSAHKKPQGSRPQPTQQMGHQPSLATRLQRTRRPDPMTSASLGSMSLLDRVTTEVPLDF